MKRRVSGKKVADITLYALSTCPWCKKTKELLNSLGVEYEYIDVDQISGQELEEAKKEIMKWNPRLSFPTVLVGDKCIIGFDEEELRKALQQ